MTPSARRAVFRACTPAEDLAFARLDCALQDLAALAGLGIGDADCWHAELALRVVARIRRAHLDARMIDRAQSPPFEELPEFEDPATALAPSRIAVLRYDAVVLVFDVAAALGDLL